jgi:hypothetical protein
MQMIQAVDSVANQLDRKGLHDLQARRLVSQWKAGDGV